MKQRTMKNDGYCDPPGGTHGCLGAFGGSEVVKVSQGRLPEKGEI